jgi:hypothetical protein
MHTRASKLGLWVATLHLFAFAITVVYTLRSVEPQAPLIWGVWALIDMPISLVYFVAGNGYTLWLRNISLSSTTLADLMYLPYVVHGFLGTIWWYFVPKLIMPRRLGGVWLVGKKADNEPQAVKSTK